MILWLQLRFTEMLLEAAGTLYLFNSFDIKYFLILFLFSFRRNIFQRTIGNKIIGKLNEYHLYIFLGKFGNYSFLTNIDHYGYFLLYPYSILI